VSERRASLELWIAIVQDEDAGALLRALLDAGVEAYAITGGGLLRRGSAALLAAVPDDRAATAVALLDNYAQTRTETRTAGLSEAAARQLGERAPPPLLVTVTGAIVYRLRVTRLERW
jgi:uncharacterized protein YaaQ